MSEFSIVLRLDADDQRDIQAAMKRRKKWFVPDGESNQEGALLAEICRGWMEFLDANGGSK